MARGKVTGTLGSKPPLLKNPRHNPILKKKSSHCAGNFQPSADRVCFLLNQGIVIAAITMAPLLPYHNREESSRLLSALPKPNVMLTINDMISRKKYVISARNRSFFNVLLQQ